MRQFQFRSPLLWILVPLIAGYSAARILPAVDPRWLALGALMLTLLSWAPLRILRGEWPMLGRWGLSLSAAVFFGAWAWWLVRVPEMPHAWQELPPREADLRIEVESTFRPPPDGRYWRGIARIAEAPVLAAELVGQRAVFSVRTPAGRSPPLPGRDLELRGVIGRMDIDPADPFSKYCQSQHVFFRLQQGRLLEALPPPTRWERHRESSRAHWTALLTRASPGQERRARILGAMLLGDRTLLNDDQKEAFLLSGTMHLFAVSGLHVMAVGGTLLGLATLLQCPIRWRGALTLLLLGVYVVVIGMPPSAVRAYAMLIFYGLGRTLNRRTSPFPAIVASAVAILLWDPRQLLMLGFQLSYAVVSSILLLGLPLGDALEARFVRDPLAEQRTGTFWQYASKLRRGSLQAFGISFVATLASAPLIVLHFEVFTPGAILLNPLLMPVAALVVVDGIVVLITGLLHLGTISYFLAHGGWLLIAIMEHVVGFALRIPALFSHRAWAAPGWGQALTLLFLLLGLVAHHRTVSTRYSPAFRFGVPLVIVLLGLFLGTRPVA